MAKHWNWPERLALFIEMRRHRPFEWGSNDCALFAADGVKAMTGVDHAAQWRGYDSELGAARRIQRAGGMAAFAKHLTEKPLDLAQRGDVVLALIDGRQTFGLVPVGGHWCAPGVEGLVFRPLDDVIHVFEC